jgi:hypothetical protein
MFKFKLISKLFLSGIIGLVTIPLAANAQATDTEANNTFENRTILSAGVTEVTGSIAPLTFVNNAPLFYTIPNLEPSEMFLAWTDNSRSFIDTILGSFDESLNVIDIGFDGSPAGDEFGSVVTGRVNSDGTINLGVTGYPDINFVGETAEQGEFELFVKLGTHEFTPLEDDHDDHDDHDEDYEDYEDYEDDHYLTGDGGEELMMFPDHDHGPTVDLDDFDYRFAGEIIQDNRIPGTLDFYTFTDLTPGDVLTAEITAGNIDSALGLFNDEGELIYADDDDGVDLLSFIPDLVVPESGQVNLAVSGNPDFEFIGRHLEDGDYTLTLHQKTSESIPEPMTILGTGFVLVVLPKLRKISRR